MNTNDWFDFCVCETVIKLGRLRFDVKLSPKKFIRLQASKETTKKQW